MYSRTFTRVKSSSAAAGPAAASLLFQPGPWRFCFSLHPSFVSQGAPSALSGGVGRHTWGEEMKPRSECTGLVVFSRQRRTCEQSAAPRLPRTRPLTLRALAPLLRRLDAGSRRLRQRAIRKSAKAEKQLAGVSHPHLGQPYQSVLHTHFVLLCALRPAPANARVSDLRCALLNLL